MHAGMGDYMRRIVRAIGGAAAIALCGTTHAGTPRDTMQVAPTDVPVYPSTVIPSWPPPVLLNGVQIGLDDQSAIINANPGAVCTAVAGSRNEQNCAVHVEYASIPAKIVYTTVDSRVVRASVTFRRGDFDRVVQYLTALYAAPQDVRRSSSLLGEEPSHAYWFVGPVQIRASKDPDRGEGVVTYESR